MKIKFNWDVIGTVVGGMVLATTLSYGVMSLINKNECKIKDRHAHLYKGLSGFTRYSEGENFINNWMIKDGDSYLIINDDNKELFEFMESNNIYSINDNKDELLKHLNNIHDYTEYEYKYDINDNSEDAKLLFTKYKSKAGLTGNARDCHYTYYAYKIINDDNELKLVRSDNVDNMLDIIDEYPYVKDNYCEVTKGELYKVELDEKGRVK